VSTAHKAFLVALAVCVTLGTLRHMHVTAGRRHYRRVHPLDVSTPQGVETNAPAPDQSDIPDSGPEPEDLEADEDVGAVENDLTTHGIRLVDGDLELVDWNALMQQVPELVRVTLAEGHRDPSDILTNLFRRLFPERSWPPSPEDPVHRKWSAMVASVGRTLERPFKPHFEIVS
jgi:hypothetical protein